MTDRVRLWRGKGAAARAREQISDDEMVCGTYLADEPVVFAMPKTATDAECQARAFEIRNGRPASESEAWLAQQIARRLAAPVPA